ncbi:hypothetical protein [Flavihumibacter profundi]|jgi:hypothetical protein|uniref:hypothetical protein n=1 Tax=Flavihumibacter profundi TaxID=2716883 RepID=UPI001CC7235D|nr:hypothetical protein [Flavihumibacter profundi]MBZ5857321.1 hypothetical protein [Flavihumibacter profundi]
MKEFLNKIGLFYVPDETNPYSYIPGDYKIENDEKKSEAHKIYLKNLENEESSRLTLIEGKTSQLISQTGIIFSLLSLFVPILIDKVTDLQFIVKLLLLILMILAFCFYMLTIRNALKNFNVKNFTYSKPSPKNVLSLQDKSLEIFYAEEVRDLLYCINVNLKINNKKATNLLHSYNSFRIANTLTGILVTVFSIVLLFFNPKKEGFVIDKPVKIENFDSSINKLTKAITAKKDTIYLKVKETPNNMH